DVEVAAELDHVRVDRDCLPRHGLAGRATHAVAVRVVAAVVDVLAILGEAGALHLDAVGRAEERLLVLLLLAQTSRRGLGRGLVLGVGLEREGVVRQEEVAEVATLLVGDVGLLLRGGTPRNGASNARRRLGAEIGRVLMLVVRRLLIPVLLVLVLVR